MRGTISFNLPEEQEDLTRALNAGRLEATIDDIWNEVFRPYRKHGYGTRYLTEDEAKELNKLFEDEKVQLAVEHLITIYTQVVAEGRE